MLRFSEGVRRVVEEETIERFMMREKELAAVRVDVGHVEDLCLRVEGWEGRRHVFAVDEPPQRGGKDLGPAPLTLFLAGASSCLMMQCVKLAMIHRLDLDELSMTAVGRFDRRLGGGFEEIVYELRVRGRAPRSAVEGMIRDAERMCITYNTLRRCLKLRLRVWYNGEAVLSE